MRAASALLFPLLLSACAGGPTTAPPFQPFPGQGQYVRPAWLEPAPTPRVPDADICNARFYQTLLGRHEGTLPVAFLPSPVRVIKPAVLEDFESEFPQLPEDTNPFREVRDFLPGQSLYAPSIRTVDDLSLLGEQRDDRLTLQLDEEGVVQEVVCR